MHQTERIGLVDVVAVVLGLDVKLIQSTLGGAGNETLPDAGLAAALQDVGARTPIIEAADHRDQPRIRRPHAEHHSSVAITSDQMGTHGLIHAVIAALIEKIKILIGEQGGERCGGHKDFRHFQRLVYRKDAG